MGLFVWFFIFLTPGVLVDLIGDNCLPALVYMHMLDGLLARLR